MRLIVLLMCVSLASSWVIYRRSHKKKLICKEESEWAGTGAATTTMPMATATSGDSSDSDESVGRRSRRDIDVDPIRREPIIHLGTTSNSTIFIDDGDFDIVSEHLSTDELKQVKLQIMETCNALNSD